jgi:hypothetical protein
MTTAGTLYEETIKNGFAKFLASATAANSATIDFVAPFTLGFNTYYWDLCNIRHTVNQAGLYVRVSGDGGATYHSAGGYRYVVFQGYALIAGNAMGSIAGGQNLAMSMGNGSQTDTPVSGRLILNNGTSPTDRMRQFTWQLASYYYSGGGVMHHFGGGTGNADIAGYPPVNAIRFYSSSGNLKDGIIRMYGLRKGI